MTITYGDVVIEVETVTVETVYAELYDHVIVYVAGDLRGR